MATTRMTERRNNAFVGVRGKERQSIYIIKNRVFFKLAIIYILRFAYAHFF